MFATQRLRVLRLQRVAVGPLALGQLAPGDVRPLSAQEVKLLRQAVGLANGP